MAATDRIALFAALLVVLPSTATADETSGTWTGRVETRGNYYWERSTRVVAPMVGARLESPNGTDVEGYYLLDAITSASVGAGALVDVLFTEVRNEGSLGASHELHFDRSHLRIGGSARVSQEPDYTSLSFTPRLQLSLNDRATVLRLSTTILHDDVRQRFRTGGQTRPMNMGGTAALSFDESFNAFSFSLSVEQLLSPTAVLVAGYDFALLRGYLSSPYRVAQVDGILMPEQHPDSRLRHTVWGRLELAIPRTRSGVHLLYRAYVDDWGISALTPEVRLYQEVGPHLLLRLRHRHYRQTGAFFWNGDPTSSYSGAPTYFTADPKMTKFHSNLFGFQTVLELAFLEDSAFHFLREAEVELTVDYLWNTNRFGNAIIAQMGLRVPFR